MNFEPLVKAFAEHPAAAIAALLALALGVLFKMYAGSQAELLRVALMVAPVAEKLAEGTKALERMIERVARREDD
jgi:hypothetical protein